MSPTTEDDPDAKTDMAVPYELLELIIAEYWASPLSRNERIAFMTMSQGISTQWACAFDKISLRDVYIPCVPYLYHYRSILSRKGPIPKNHESLPARHACRTLTYQRPHSQIAGTSLTRSVSQKAAAHLMDTLHAIPHLPNLRHLYLEYFPIHPEGESHKHYTLDFPLTTLDVEYCFQPSVPQALVRAMGRTGDPLCSPWLAPTIRHVSVWEATHESTLVKILLACPKLENVSAEGVHMKVPSDGGANDQFIFHLPVPELSAANLRERRSEIFSVKAKALGVCLESLSPLVPTQACKRTWTSTRRVFVFQRLGLA